jgi:hypothetical protein
MTGRRALRSAQRALSGDMVVPIQTHQSLAVLSRALIAAEQDSFERSSVETGK